MLIASRTIASEQLRDRYPQADFEVIVAGITATNSHIVLPVARECVRYDADLLIVYLGNNEVIGPFGLGAGPNRSVPSPGAIRFGLWLKTTRLGQLIQQLVQGQLGSVVRAHIPAVPEEGQERKTAGMSGDDAAGVPAQVRLDGVHARRQGSIEGGAVVPGPVRDGDGSGGSGRGAIGPLTAIAHPSRSGLRLR